MKRGIFFCLILIVMLFTCAYAHAEDCLEAEPEVQNQFVRYELNPNEVLFNQSRYYVDVIDPKASTNSKGANYPGLRGANQPIAFCIVKIS